MRLFQAGALLALAIAVAACGADGGVATTAATPSPTPPGRLYADDFANPQSGWPVTSSAAYTTAYGNSPHGAAYEVSVTDTVVRIPAPIDTLPRSLDIKVGVEETGTGGASNDSHLGVACRYGSVDYVLQVGSPGYFGIVKFRGGALVSVLTDSLSKGPSKAVADPPAVNRIEAICLVSGSTIQLTLNVGGTVVATATDTDDAVATQKPAVVLRDEPGVQASTAYFSDLVVSKPATVTAPAGTTAATASATATP